MGGKGMRKNVLVKIGERTETRERIVPAAYGESGDIITPETVEQYTVNVPIIEARNVEMTSEEITELERMQAELPEPDMTTEERLGQVESVSDMAYINSELALAMLEEMEV